MKYALIKIGGKPGEIPRTGMFVIEQQSSELFKGSRPGIYDKRRYIHKDRVVKLWENKPSGKQFAAAKEEFRQEYFK